MQSEKKFYLYRSYFPSPGSSESYYNLYLGEVNSFDGVRIMGLRK